MAKHLRTIEKALPHIGRATFLFFSPYVLWDVSGRFLQVFLLLRLNRCGPDGYAGLLPNFWRNQRRYRVSLTASWLASGEVTRCSCRRLGTARHSVFFLLWRAWRSVEPWGHSGILCLANGPRTPSCVPKFPEYCVPIYQLNVGM